MTRRTPDSQSVAGRAGGSIRLSGQVLVGADRVDELIEALELITGEED